MGTEAAARQARRREAPPACAVTRRCRAAWCARRRWLVVLAAVALLPAVAAAAQDRAPGCPQGNAAARDVGHGWEPIYAGPSRRAYRLCLQPSAQPTGLHIRIQAGRQIRPHYRSLAGGGDEPACRTVRGTGIAVRASADHAAIAYCALP